MRAGNNTHASAILTVSDIFVFVINLSLRLSFLVLFFDKNTVDLFLPASMDEIAMSLIHHRLFNYPTAWSSFHILLSSVYAPLQIFGLLEYRFLAVALLNVLFSSLSAVFVYRIARRLYSEKAWTAYGITGLFTLYYPLYYVNQLAIPESIFTFILTGLFYTLITYQFNMRTAIITGILLALGLIAKPIMLPLTIFIICWLLWFRRRSVTEMVKLFLAGAGCFLILCLIAAYVNSRLDIHHQFVVVGNGGVNFTMAWCEPRYISYSAANGEKRWYAPPVFAERSDLPVLAYNVPFSNQLFYYRQGLECIVRNPQKILTNLMHVTNIFHSVLYPDLFHAPFHRYNILIWKILILPLFFGLILFPFINKRLRSEWALGMMFFLSLLISVYTSNPGEERYLIPYYFILILFGGGALANSLQH